MRTRQSTESLGGVSVSFGHRTVVSGPGLFVVVVGNKSDIHGIYFLFPSKQLSRPSAPAETVLVEDNYIKICSVKYVYCIVDRSTISTGHSLDGVLLKNL